MALWLLCLLFGILAFPLLKVPTLKCFYMITHMYSCEESNSYLYLCRLSLVQCRFITSLNS